MKIRWKILIITSLLGALIILFTVLIANIIIMPGFISVEDSRTVKNVERVNEVLLEKIHSIDSVDHDYATWDNSYYAVTGENAHYDSTDLAGSLENTNLDFVILMRNDGQIIFAKDIFSGEERDYNNTTTDLGTKALYQYFSQNYALITCRDDSTNFNGLIQLPNDLAMISSRPVLKTDGTGPVQATIIFGKMIDKSFIEKLSNQTHMSISLDSYDSISYGDKLKLDKLFSSDNINNVHSVTTILINESNDSDILVQILHVNESVISGNVLLKDIFGKPVTLLEIIDRRDIYAEGKNAAGYIVQAMLVAVLLFILAGYLLFNKFIVTRLVSMEHQMREIQSKKLASTRITIMDNDELSSLGKAVNNTLDIIEKATEEKQAVFEADPDTYFYVDSSWKILDYKITETLGGMMHQKNVDMLKNPSLTALFNSTVINKFSKARLESIKDRKPIILEFDTSIDGSQKVFEARIVAVNNNNNNNPALVLLRDITDRKKFEQQLLEKNQDLEKFNKFAIDREIKMGDLKKEMRDLKNKTEKQKER